MENVIQSASRAFKSLFDPGLLPLFLLCTILSICTIAALLGGVSYGLNHWLLTDLNAAEQWIIGMLQGVVGVMIAWMLFPLILPLVVGFFDDRIAALIEAHNYADQAVTVSQPFWNEFWHDVRFSLKALLLNILCLPLYFVPLLNLIVFYWLNAYLLGTQFFTMVAARSMSRANANACARKVRSDIMIGGLFIVVLATIPLVNIIAPFFGVALMVHLYHRLFPVKPMISVISAH